MHNFVAIGEFILITVWKHTIWVKLGDFLSPVTLKFDNWLWKTIAHLFYSTLSNVHHFVAICEFKLELWSGKPKLGQNLLWPLWPWPCILCTVNQGIFFFHFELWRLILALKCQMAVWGLVMRRPHTTFKMYGNYFGFANLLFRLHDIVNYPTP